MNQAYVAETAERLYREATPEQVETGHKWYPRAFGIIAGIALETDTSVDLVAKVIAVTSINQSWKGNITLTRRYCTNREPLGLPRVRDNLARIERGEDISGRKIAAFAKAIKGDRSAVVVDRWMFRAFGYKLGSKAKAYDTVALGITDAAGELDIAPRALQAVIWVIARGRGE